MAQCLQKKSKEKLTSDLPDSVPFFGDGFDPPVLGVLFFFTDVDVPFPEGFFDSPEDVPLLGLRLIDTRPLEVFVFSSVLVTVLF